MRGTAFARWASDVLRYRTYWAARLVVPPRFRPHVKRIAQLRHRLLLRNARANARGYWPDVRGIDHVLLAMVLALVPYHLVALEFVCARAHVWRRFRRPRRAAGRKVLHVTCSFDLGGTQTQIKNLCGGSEAVTYDHEAVEIFPEANYLFRRGVSVDPARYFQRGPIGRTFGRLVTNISTRSVQLVQIYKLVRDIRATRPDIVVGWGHEICMLTFVAAAIARAPHVVFCVRTFNPDYGWMLKPMDRIVARAHRRMFPLLSKVVVNSTPLQQDYAAWLDIDRSRVSVCANGIDKKALEPFEASVLRADIRRRFGIGEDALVIVNVGRFSGEKGQMSIVQANLALREWFPRRPFYFVLCGDGPTLAEVQAFAASHGMTNVLFPGRTDEVRAFLSAADIFVMPSDFEGMPNAMMEAMAEGLPCVSTDRSGAVDIARQDLEALYYPPRDVDALASRLRYLFEHPEERRQMGLRAQARMKGFSVARFVETFERELDLLPMKADREAQPPYVVHQPLAHHRQNES